MQSSRKRPADLGRTLAPNRAGESFRAFIRILIETAEASDIPADTALYLFGSSCWAHMATSDIDILIVYPNGRLDQANLLAESVRGAATSVLFDVLALSASEERELAFVQTERALRIWSR